MKRRNQNGFSVIELLIIVTIFGVIGFTGLKVYEAKQIADSSLDSANNVSNGELTASEHPRENSEPVPEGWSQYTSEKIGLTFNYPDSWGEPIETEPLDSVWSLNFEGTGIFMRAQPKTDCPQGDAPLLANSQGFYFRDGTYYLNVCPEEEFEDEFEFDFGNSQPGVLKLSDGNEVIYKEYEGPCGNFYCDQESAEKKLNTLTALINLKKDPYTGAGVYVTRLEGVNPTYDEVQADIFTMLKSFSTSN